MIFLLFLLVADAPKPLDALVRVLTKTNDDAVRRDILIGMGEALAGRRSVKAPAGWSEARRKLATSGDPEVRRRSLQLALVFGDTSAIGDLRKMALNKGATPSEREFALVALLDRGDKATLSVVHQLLDDKAMRRVAVQGLARFDDKATPSLLLSRFAGLDRDTKEAAIGTLSSRPAWAIALLDAIEKKKVRSADVSAYWARQMVALKDKAVTTKLEKVWGAVRATPKDREALLKKYRVLATPERAKDADRSKGRVLYAKTCAGCHAMFGEGGKIGPELTGSQRRNADYILAKVLDPNATVPREFQTSLIRTKRGRVITGVIKSGTDKLLVVQTPTEELRVVVSDVESREPLKTSLMPEGQLKDWPENDVRDLLAYLAGETQVALPKAP